MQDLNADATRIVIMGAAGRDFHNFNTVYREDAGTHVVAFTATQIPHITGRCYPRSLAGARYPEGIPILDEADLADLCRREHVQQVVFGYSDVSHQQVMHQASIALASGTDFLLLGPERTMLPASVPVIAVSAVRTGCGKSQIARWLSRRLREHGLTPAVIRHPMPYGDLQRQAVQRFSSMDDLDRAQCTVEEREEYEPHLALGNTLYAGVDYQKIVERAQLEADVLLWDGGNNDFPFIRPDLHIVLIDPLRPGHEDSHHPGETVLRMADVIVVAKSGAAADIDVQAVSARARRINPHAPILRGRSPVTLDDPDAVRGKRVLVVEDGPTITHGEMAYGAGFVAATRAQAMEIVDPRSSAVGDIAEAYIRYPHIGAVLPALGYSLNQLAELGETINRSDAELVVLATPCDLTALIAIDKPVVRARYEYAEGGEPGLAALLDDFLLRHNLIRMLCG